MSFQLWEACKMAKANRYNKKDNYRLWSIYHSMKKRCYNENCKRYKDYGGRGVTICPKWLESFDNFADWAYSNGYEENLTLDREDNNKGYSPDNCRWITNKKQCNNTRKNVNIEYMGQVKTLREWCDELNLSYYTVQKRIKKGWSTERAFTEKSQQENSFAKMCKEHNINQGTVISRVKSGWTLEKALNTPTKGRGAGAKDYGHAEKAKCPICGKCFEKKNGMQKYCCFDCRNKASKERRK